jgi:hypothetical protein
MLASAHVRLPWWDTMQATVVVWRPMVLGLQILTFCMQRCESLTYLDALHVRTVYHILHAAYMLLQRATILNMLQVDVRTL